MKRSFQQRMARLFDKCPGAVSAELPASERASGRILIDPVCVREARLYLRRRFHVNSQVTIESTGEISFEIVARIRNPQLRAKRVTVLFRRPEQFELHFNEQIQPQLTTP